MRCKEIERLLSEYVDGLLDDKARAHIDKHLLSCRNCQRKLDSFKAVLNQVSGLAPVHPPADFLKKIHARIETDSLLKQIFKRLFVPFRIKIPLGFATAVTFGLLIFFIVNTEQIQDTKGTVISKAPFAISEKKSNTADTLFAHKALKEESPAESALIDTLPEPVSTLQNKPIVLALLIHPKGADLYQAPLMEMDRGQAADKEPARLEKRKRQTMHLADSDTFGKSEAESPERADTPSAPLDNALLRIRQLTTQIQGSILPGPDEKDEDLQQSLLIEIPSGEYNSFVNQLRQIGDFQSPPPQVSSMDAQKLRLEIRFMTLP